jgi:hypothetical protein
MLKRLGEIYDEATPCFDPPCPMPCTAEARSLVTGQTNPGLLGARMTPTRWPE